MAMAQRSLKLAVVLLAALHGTPAARAQAAPPQSAPDTDRLLPDIPTLMHEVETHQRASEAIQKDYLYHEVATEQESDGHGGLKKNETTEYDVFWLNGVQVHKLIKKNGKSLTPDEQKKEDEHIDKEVAKAKERRSKAEEKGEETDSHGHEEVTVSRFLSLGSFTNPRRVQINGRDTIAVDYTGDPKAKTRNRFEDVIRDLTGTIWVDEQDRSITRIEGRFVNAFKIGGGLVVNIKKDTSFSFEQRKVNSEVWLPASVDAKGALRALLFYNINGNIRVVDSDYRKFKATSTILPGVSTVEDPSSNPTPATPQ
jgi:hypothetical protein